MKHNYLIGGLLLFATALGSCSDTQTDLTDQPVTEGNTPILLTGILSRATGCDDGTTTTPTYSNLHLSADTDNGTNNTPNYFYDVKIDNVTLPLTATEDKETLKTDPLFYPLGAGLRFFAYSGTIGKDGRSMKLTAGNADDKDDKIDHDFILSNGTVGKEDEGKGIYGDEQTKGNILLTFRHVMTKIFVGVEVDKEGNDNDDNEHVNPDPETIKITLNDGLAVASGDYPITAKATPGTGSTDVTNQQGSYTLQKGVNYLVPNGAVLYDQTKSIKPISKIVIDDYSDATNCKTLSITPATGASNTIQLRPGQAYGIFLKIKRLKVTEITFTKVDWDTVDLRSENSSYVPAKLNLNLGNYNQSADKDTITKVILHNSENGVEKQYVGNILYEETSQGKKPVGQFVNLPTATNAPTKVDLYTSQGLLVAGVTPDASSYKDASSSTTDKDITISLSAGGMKTVSGSDYNANSNPYAVQTPIQFSNMGKDLTASYRQSTDLDLETLTTAFTPIGSATAFSGTYDGNGKRILHATFSGNGLFATNSGTLKNIRIASGIITATGTHAGSICGINEAAGKIVACINEAQIHGTATYAGGICGKNSGSIIACLNTGDIFTGSSYSGGICGENESSTQGAITACVNVGMMNRNSTNMAGICGVVTATTKTSLLKTCYWLTGTAKKKYDDNLWGNDKTEVAANINDNTHYSPDNADDVADLSPQKLRDKNTSEEAEDKNKTTALLSTACQSTDYKFTYAVETNGCVWPMPVKK